MPGSPILGSTGGDPDTSGGANQAGAASTAESTADESELASVAAVTPDSLFYSVQVAALGGLSSALEYAAQFEAAWPSTVSAVRRGEGRILYRVMVGALPSANIALNLRQQLRTEGLLAGAEGIVVRTPHALQLGQRPDPTSAAQAVRSLRASGIPAYMLDQPDGSALLLTGAFETADQAQLTDSVLPISGAERTVVARYGVARSD